MSSELIPPRPVSASERWRLHKPACGRAREAVCQLWPHADGWELRVVIDGGEVSRVQVCQSEEEMRAVTEQWKVALIERGWC